MSGVVRAGSELRRDHLALDPRDLDLDPRDLLARLRPLGAAERGGVAPVPRLGVLDEQLLARGRAGRGRALRRVHRSSSTTCYPAARGPARISVARSLGPVG